MPVCKIAAQYFTDIGRPPFNLHCENVVFTLRHELKALPNCHSKEEASKLPGDAESGVSIVAFQLPFDLLNYMNY